MRKNVANECRLNNRLRIRGAGGLHPLAQWRADFEIGALTAAEAQQMEGKIDKLLGKK